MKKFVALLAAVIAVSVFFTAVPQNSVYPVGAAFSASAESLIDAVATALASSAVPETGPDAGSEAASSAASSSAGGQENNTVYITQEPESAELSVLVNYAAAYEDELPIRLARKPYYVRINYIANTVNIFTLDENGDYTVPYKVMVCSTGDDTPHEGAYRTGVSHRWHTLFGGVYAQYTVQITGNILFHSVPYLEKGNPATLEYWEFDKLGTSCSAGCIRLQVIDAKWIYDNRSSIQLVEFYGSEDPGPLGKPDAPVISGNVYCRDWDPTDPDPDNLWYR